MINVTEPISKLNLSTILINKLINNNIEKVNDLWKLTRKELKNMGFTDSEIKNIMIVLQLEGLDLNGKIYD